MSKEPVDVEFFSNLCDPNVCEMSLRVVCDMCVNLCDPNVCEVLGECLRDVFAMHTGLRGGCTCYFYFFFGSLRDPAYAVFTWRYAWANYSRLLIFQIVKTLLAHFWGQETKEPV